MSSLFTKKYYNNFKHISNYIPNLKYQGNKEKFKCMIHVFDAISIEIKDVHILHVYKNAMVNVHL